MNDTPDPKTAREIAREHLTDFLRRWPMVDPFFVGSRVLGALDDPELWRTDPAAYNAWCEATVAEIRTAVPSWPAEQPQDMCSCNEPRAVCELRTELDKREIRIAELEAENARMREEVEALREAQPSLQGSAFRIGWQTCRDKVNRATELLRGELAALDYAEEVRKLNAEPSPDPEMFADDCDCECQPGQPCLCPERDCYCGPCPVCGENPQQPVGNVTRGSENKPAIGDCTMACVMGHTNEPGCLYDTTEADGGAGRG